MLNVIITQQEWLDSMIRLGTKSIFSIQVTLTPELAALLLEINEDNRVGSRQRTDEYAASIVAGKWKLNGESIIIANDGLMNSGQTRCAAVIKAGKPIETMFTFGVERDTRFTLDQGRKRTQGNLFEMKKIKNANKMAPACRLAMRYLTGQIGDNQHTDSESVLDFYDKNEIIQDSFHAVRKCVNILHVPSGPATACHFLFWKVSNREAADDFFERMASCIGDTSRDPILRARKYVLKLAEKHHRIQERAFMGLLINAWNIHRGVFPLSHPVEWASGTPFPSVKGRQ